METSRWRLVSGGVPANLSGDFGNYCVLEQKLYRVGNDDDRGVRTFLKF
jgi:porin